MTYSFETVYLSWRKGRSSRRHIVGKINVTDKQLEFTYLTDGVASAKVDGFTSYTEFPHIDRSYQDGGVQNILFQRLTPSSRSSTSVTLDFWGVPKDKRDDKLVVLAYTQGLLPTDTYEFLADFKPIEGLSFISDVAGLSYQSVPVDLLDIGDELRWEFELENQYDLNAITLFKNDYKIGYVKRIHANVFKKYRSGNIKISVHAVEKNGTVKNVFVSINLF